MDFNGVVAFTIEDPIAEENQSIPVLFEYGHIYDEQQYELWYGTFTVAVFVSESPYNHYRNNGEYTLLYESVIEDFVTNEYKCDVDLSNIFDIPEFPKSFELSIISEDIPYEKGKLYFVLNKGEFFPEQEEVLPTVYQVVYFTNVDGVLNFTLDNPF
ncbi:MAG: hypothetical protein JEZ05_11045 [Tenericutes bacterium]|nr:hypothetical protein [Mycoplasmatota bacterium]